MAVITDQMVSHYAHYLLARVDQDDEAPFTPAGWPVTVLRGYDPDVLAARFWVDADGQVLEITVRPLDPARPLPWQTPKPASAVKVDVDPEAWAYL
jgi:hypothetical protein